MIKLILFDVDNVLITLPYFYSAELEKIGHKNAKKILDQFYNNKDNLDCLEGKADIEKLIVPYLKKIRWNDTASDYLKETFRYESDYLDNSIMNQIKSIRQQGIKCCLCTDQEKHRAKFLLDELNFNNKFDKHYISCQIGWRKCNRQFWSILLNNLKNDFPDIKKNEIVFFDDLQINIDTALKSGFKAFLFTNKSQLKKDLTMLKII